MITENLSTLKIHKLTQAQYNRELEEGRIDESALYLTPDEEVDLSPYATLKELDAKADIEHSHSISDIDNLQNLLDNLSVASLKGCAEGETVSITDASPLEHKMNVQLNFGHLSAYDYNEDGVLDESDAEYLLNHVNFSGSEDFSISEDKIADVDGNGEINVDDTFLLKELINGDISGVTLTKYGNNLLHYPYTFTSQSINGMNVVVNNDGTMSISGVPTKATSLRFTNNLVLEKGQYFLRVFQEKESVSTSIYYAYVKVGDNYYYDNGVGVVFTITEQTSVIVGLIIGASYDGTRKILKPQISFGTTATEYEPFKEPVVYTPNADGTVDGVTSLYPTTILTTNVEGITITTEYIKNVNEALNIEPSNETDTSLVVGANISNVLRYTKQDLTDAQKAQIIENLGLTDYIQSMIQNYLDTTITEG